MSTDREQLIEAAAMAILDAAETPEDIRDEQVRQWARRDARAAFAVFEKAHTPTGIDLMQELGFSAEDARAGRIAAATGDEREALLHVLTVDENPDVGDWLWAERRERMRKRLGPRADAILAAGFRRTVQGEASDAQCDDAIRAFHVATFGEAEPEFLTEQRLARMRAPWRAALRAAGVTSSQREPEWEYRYAEVHDDGSTYTYGPKGNPDWSFPTVEAARAEAVEESDVIVQRTKAGPWVSVQAPESEEN